MGASRREGDGHGIRSIVTRKEGGKLGEKKGNIRWRKEEGEHSKNNFDISKNRVVKRGEKNFRERETFRLQQGEGKKGWCRGR